MNKNYRRLFFLALTAPMCAHADNGVTVYGVLDVSVAHGTGSVSSSTKMNAGDLWASRIGFRGSEDLGGGLSAHFVLEAGINNDTGAGFATNTNNQVSGATPAGFSFNRQSWVGLAGSWGEIHIGRDYTPTFRQYIQYDPSLGGGLAASQAAFGSLVTFGNPAGIRASNSFGYLLPKLGGWSGHVMYALGENPSGSPASKDGNFYGARLAYAEGPIDVGVAHAVYKLAAVNDYHETVAGGTFTMGQAKLWGLYTINNSGSGNNMKGPMVALSYSFGVDEVRGSISRSKVTSFSGTAIGTANKASLTGIHYLSKRTSLYAQYARVTNSDGGTAVPWVGVAVNGPNGTSSAYEFGLRHLF